jgi:hypothetical protein
MYMDLMQMHTHAARPAAVLVLLLPSRSETAAPMESAARNGPQAMRECLQML